MAGCLKADTTRCVQNAVEAVWRDGRGKICSAWGKE